MRYEVISGTLYSIQEASTPYQAALLALANLDDTSYEQQSLGNFQVQNLDTLEEETIPLDVVLHLLLKNTEYQLTEQN